MKRILLVNGINVSAGGANTETLNHWRVDLDKYYIYKQWDLMPTFVSPKMNAGVLGRCLALLYTFPGCLARMIPSVIFEYALKISPFVVLRFLLEIIRFKPDQVIFSHHSTFFLMLFVPKLKRKIVIHDLISNKAMSLGSSKEMAKIILRFEKKIISLASSVGILSYREFRCLQSVLRNPSLWLISCRDISSIIKVPSETKDVAIVADWSRTENQHGLIKFFDGYETLEISPIYLYGKGSDLFFGSLNNNLQNIFIDCGRFSDFLDIKQKFILVPIYRGAGIKAKVLDCIKYSKKILGTVEAFSGLPPKIRKMVGVKVTSACDIQQYIELSTNIDFPSDNVAQYLQNHFNSITVLVSK